MAEARVLIVDDSATIRMMLKRLLEQDPSVAAVLTAANGEIGLEKVRLEKPDVIICDVEMPGMSGLDVLRKLREDHSRTPVIMFSSLTEKGASTTLEALSMGAADYVTKPTAKGPGTRDEIERMIRGELVRKIRALHIGEAVEPVRIVPRPVAPVAPAGRADAAVAPAPRRRRARTDVQVLAIGVSTGGPNALGVVIPALPAGIPVPIVIVQHMPPVFTRHLAERLAQKSAIDVREGVAGAPLEPGVAWVAPGGHHMVVKKSGNGVVLDLNQEAEENSCRPAVDVLFRSVAEVYGGDTLGVILTGMGSDGLKGCEQLHDLGAPILAQDEATSVVWGMPGWVAKSGLADKVLPLDQIAPEIQTRTRCLGMTAREPNRNEPTRGEPRITVKP